MKAMATLNMYISPTSKKLSNNLESMLRGKLSENTVINHLMRKVSLLRSRALKCECTRGNNLFKFSSKKFSLIYYYKYCRVCYLHSISRISPLNKGRKWYWWIKLIKAENASYSGKYMTNNVAILPIPCIYPKSGPVYF